MADVVQLIQIPEKREEPGWKRAPWWIIAVGIIGALMYVFERSNQIPSAFLPAYYLIAVGLLFASIFIEIWRHFARALTAEVDRGVRTIEAALNAGFGLILADIRTNLVDYSDLIGSYPIDNDARLRFLNMMRNHRLLGGAGNEALLKIAALVLARQATEMAVDGGVDVTLRVPKTSTYPIYDVVLNSAAQAETLQTVNRIDLAWWVEGSDPTQYINDNHRALREGRIREIRRIFILDHRQWDEKAKNDLKTIRDRILLPEYRDRIELKAIFDNQIKEDRLKALDVVIRSSSLAVEWVHAYDDGSYPELRVLTSDARIRQMAAQAATVFGHTAAVPIDQFLTAHA
jgi:hypothetical protein